MFRFISSIYNYAYLCLLSRDFFKLSQKKSLDNDDINEFVKKIIPYIRSSGCVCIKFCQWVTPILDNVYNTHNENPQWLQTLEEFYEDCSEHSIDHTLTMYKQDFKENLNGSYEIIDIIGSGSIGQVYKIRDRISNEYLAMKVLHPYVHYDMILFRYILYFIYSIPYFNHILFQLLPINLVECMDLFETQLDMINESNSLCQFNYNYKDNQMILIPDLIKCSPNIIIMSYIEGTLFDKSSISDYEKMKLYTIFFLFIWTNWEFTYLNHCDLHKGNWKITNDNKIVIYDFGYTFKYTNTRITKLIETVLSNDSIEPLVELVSELINDTSNETITYIRNYIHNTYNWASSKDDMFRIIFEIAKQLRKYIDTTIIIIILVKIQTNKNTNKYNLSNVNENFSTDDYLYRREYINYLSLCQTYDIFPELQEYYKKILNSKQVEVNELFDIVDQSEDISDEIRNLLKFK